MADKPNSISGEDTANPYAAPTAEVADRWQRGDPNALALRRAGRKDESYFKGLAILNFLYFLFFGVSALFDISTLILHLTGRQSAPWILRPGRFTVLFLIACLPIPAFGAAVGFLRRKRWALRFELALAGCWLLFWVSDAVNNPGAATFIGLACAHAAIAAPMLTALRLHGSIVSEPGYSDAIAATSHIWVWPKLPLKPTLIALAFFVGATVFIGLSVRS